jgi:hypothetical protein
MKSLPTGGGLGISGNGAEVDQEGKAMSGAASGGREGIGALFLYVWRQALLPACLVASMPAPILPVSFRPYPSSPILPTALSYQFTAPPIEF